MEMYNFKYVKCTSMQTWSIKQTLYGREERFDDCRNQNKFNQSTEYFQACKVFQMPATVPQIMEEWTEMEQFSASKFLNSEPLLQDEVK